MKLFYCIVLLSLQISVVLAQNPYHNFDYLDPLPGSKYINEEATIIIRPKPDINISTLSQTGAIKILTNNIIENSFSYKIKCLRKRIFIS